MDDTLEIAKKCGLWDSCFNAPSVKQLQSFREEIEKLERERCSAIAEHDYILMKETEQAHYCMSIDPFNPDNFGFDMDVIRKGRMIAEAMRKGDKP